MTFDDTEDTPLLQTSKHEEVYKRFKPSQKRWILAIVSATGLLPRESNCERVFGVAQSNHHLYLVFVSGTFIPSIPQIAKDLDSTPSVIR